MNSASAKRIDIISDTHGYLSPALLDELEGADLIIHAGDLTSEMDYEHLRRRVAYHGNKADKHHRAHTRLPDRNK